MEGPGIEGSRHDESGWLKKLPRGWLFLNLAY